MKAVVTTMLAASLRRLVQTAVVAVVALLSTATAVLGVGLLVVSDAPFDNAFAAQSGAHATALFDPEKADAQTLAGTAQRPGVVAAAGPFESIIIDLDDFGIRAATVVGRGDPDGAVDRLALDEGRFLGGTGEIVIARHAIPPFEASREGITVGQLVTIGRVKLRLVGVADSITNTADAWVWPGQNDLLHAPDVVRGRQMLYRFTSADDKGALAAATAQLPPGSLIASTGYATSKLQANSTTAPIVPFVVAFAVLGLVMSVLIVANVANGAVVSGYRVIGILKSLGFKPGQVVAVYIGQLLVPATFGALGGLVTGNIVAIPVLRQAQRAYDVAAATTLPLWVWVTVPLALIVLTGFAAATAAWRAGRIPSAQAIAIGRAPRTGRGYRIRRRLAATRLPRPISFGIGTLFARPARSAGTLVALIIGTATVVFATGLSTTLNRAADSFTRTASVPIDVTVQPKSDLEAVRAAISAQPGTARLAGYWRGSAQVAGVNSAVAITGYDSTSNPGSAWVGYELISGRWFSAPGEVVVSSRLSGVTGTRIGNSLTVTTELGHLTVRVVGEIFDYANDGFSVIGDHTTLATVAGNPRPQGFEVSLEQGVDAKSYRSELSDAFAGQPVDVRLRAGSSSQYSILLMLALVATLTTLLTSVAASGVFNTVVLNTRERVHEIGVLKSLGMTPHQTRTMVLSSMIGVGLVAGVIAVPLGVALHHEILPRMGRAVGTGLPASLYEVYSLGQLAALAAAGIALAAVASLFPAYWASRTHPASALRAE
ncbi:MAG TPA: FtsX-like permease family protein [Candidatus Limnocylindrales bacterium]